MSLLKVTVLLGVILAADASASMLMSFYTNMGETNTKCSYDNVPVASGGDALKTIVLSTTNSTCRPIPNLADTFYYLTQLPTNTSTNAPEGAFYDLYFDCKQSNCSDCAIVKKNFASGVCNAHFASTIYGSSWRLDNITVCPINDVGLNMTHSQVATYVTFPLENEVALGASRPLVGGTSKCALHSLGDRTLSVLEITDNCTLWRGYNFEIQYYTLSNDRGEYTLSLYSNSSCDYSFLRTSFEARQCREHSVGKYDVFFLVEKTAPACSDINPSGRSSNTKLIIIVSCSVGGGVLLLALILICVCQRRSSGYRRIN